MKMVLIGGGDTGRGRSTYQTKEIDEEIVKMTTKENPTFLFIGLASSHSDSYYDTMKKIYKNLGCNTVYLKKKNMIHNPDLVKEKINKADIIYICGGDTVKLINDVNEYKLDDLLKCAMDRDCIMVGMSAGAILLTKEGFSDSYIYRGEDDKYKFVKGLNLFPLSICPHYHTDINKEKDLKEELKKNNREIYCLENGTALKIIDGKISIIKSIKEHSIYKVTYEDKLIEKRINM